MNQKTIIFPEVNVWPSIEAVFSRDLRITAIISMKINDPEAYAKFCAELEGR